MEEPSPTTITSRMSGHEELVYREVADGFLEIDEAGRIWRVKRRFYNRRAGEIEIRAVAPHRRVERVERHGYMRVRRSLGSGSDVCVTMAHRLVWRHFNGPIPEGKTINHINGERTDNRPENLELATHLEQREHCRTVLGKTFKLGPQDAATIRLARCFGAPARLIAEAFGVSRETVWSVVTGRTHAHG